LGFRHSKNLRSAASAISFARTKVRHRQARHESNKCGCRRQATVLDWTMRSSLSTNDGLHLRPLGKRALLITRIR
jgi:hypothetical protein